MPSVEGEGEKGRRRRGGGGREHSTHVYRAREGKPC